jgi:hypothetical protein
MMILREAVAMVVIAFNTRKEKSSFYYIISTHPGIPQVPPLHHLSESEEVSRSGDVVLDAEKGGGPPTLRGDTVEMV